jgi:hypothetical protein
MMCAVYDARTRSYLARCLADAFLSGVWNERALGDRAGRSLDRRPRWVRAIARTVIAANAGVSGPGGENRAGVPDLRAHLLGRIAWVESLNPGRGEKLRRQFARIAWPDEE